MGRKKLLIYGCGVHGERLLKLLLKFDLSISIYEPQTERGEFLQQTYPDLNIHNDLIDVENDSKKETYEYACVLNWGPDHYQSVEYLKKIGTKKVFIEKPLVTSREELNLIKNLFSENFQIYSNLPRKYSNLEKKFFEFNKHYNLTGPYQIIVHAGAKGIVTTGIHYIDIANQAFSSLPEKVFGFGDSLKINPRNKEFDYWGGVLSWNYSNNRSLTIGFNNKSKMDTHIEIYFDFAKLSIDEDGNGFIEVIEGRETPITRVSYGEKFEQKDFFGDYLELFETLLGEFIGNNNSNSAVLDDFNYSIDLTTSLLAGLDSITNQSIVSVSRNSLSDTKWQVT